MFSFLLPRSALAIAGLAQDAISVNGNLHPSKGRVGRPPLRSPDETGLGLIRPLPLPSAPSCCWLNGVLQCQYVIILQCSV